MPNRNIGKIETVDMKEVWPHEAQDFTPWLAENLDLLGQQIGRELELVDTEVSVGSYKLDILARDANSDSVVAIENQIAGTDHTHLGQLLTYAAGREAQLVIWIATKFSDEHRAALNWLNEGTNESLNFFGIEVKAVRIGESDPAPLFNLASTPNSWSKEIKASPNNLTPRQQKYVSYWKPLLAKLNNKFGWSIATENSFSYYDAGSGLRTGFGNFRRRMRFTNDGEARVELLLQGGTKEWNEKAFDLLMESKEQIEEEFGPMVWERLDDAKISRVGLFRSGSIDDSEDELDEIRAWMIENVNRFPTVFRPYLDRVMERLRESDDV